MNRQVRGTAVKAVKGATLTDDGAHMLLGFETMGGEEMVLLMPIETASALIVLAAQCSGESERRKGGESRNALNVTKWKLVKDAGSDQDVLMLTVGGQAELAFRLPTRDPREALKVLANPESGEDEQAPADPSKLN